MNLNKFLICAEFEVKKTSVSSFYKNCFYKNNFKLCLTKQLLNMFKLWCEWSISQYFAEDYMYILWVWNEPLYTCIV